MADQNTNVGVQNASGLLNDLINAIGNGLANNQKSNQQFFNQGNSQNFQQLNQQGLASTQPVNQNEPQVGALKSVTHSADGSIKQEFHPPVQQNGVSDNFNGNTSTVNTPNSNTQQNNQPTQLEPGKSFGDRLMMFGAGLQGQNPMDILAGLQKAVGQQPIQPEQKLEYSAKMFSAKRETLSNQVTAFNDQLKSLGDELTQVRQLPMNVRWGKEKTILGNMDKVHTNLGKAIKNLREFSSGKQENNIPKGATHYSPSKNKYYDVKGNEVK